VYIVKTFTLIIFFITINRDFITSKITHQYFAVLTGYFLLSKIDGLAYIYTNGILTLS